MELELKNISVKYPDWGMNNVSLLVESGTFLSVVGPSGCGKTTLLKTISGLQPHSSGTVLFDGKIVDNVPVHKRGIGFVFQGNTLFSHLNVFENVAFGLRIKKQEGIEKKVENLLALVGLKGFSQRNVLKLSGGQQRRVEIARALAIEPKLLLMDEPLTGLDAKLREKLKQQIKEIQSKFGVTTVYVTHDIEEAFFLSDKIAVMSDAKIEQIGSPEEIFLKPKTPFVKEFVSDYSIIEARIEKNGAKKSLKASIGIPMQGIEEGTFLLPIKKNNLKKKPV